MCFVYCACELDTGSTEGFGRQDWEGVDDSDVAVLRLVLNLMELLPFGSFLPINNDHFVLRAWCFALRKLLIACFELCLGFVFS